MFNSKSVFFSVIFSLCLALPALAGDDIKLGGKAVCRFSGGVEKFSKKIKSIENSFVIDSVNNSIELEFDGEFFNDEKDVSVNIFAPISDIDIQSLLSGELIYAESDEVDFSIFSSKGNDDFEITNMMDEGEIDDVQVLIQISENSNKGVSGDIKLRFLNTVSIDSNNNDEEIPNGKVVANCEFTNIPITKDELF